MLVHRIDGILRVLFLRNERNEWELPGGRPECGERPDQSLAREFLEETGLRVKVGRSLHSGVLTILPPLVAQVTTVSIAVYTCFLEDAASVTPIAENPAYTNPKIVLSHEHCGTAWIGIDDVARMEDIPGIYKTSVLNWKREPGNPDL